ncbi:MAG: hypothetical protein FMNOHCHN_02568 [Ignavibacteriaceae bacterium]|nr:hypothetical protein [Ignavibacteriaceae bacterium]
MIKHRSNDPFCECYDCTFNGCRAYKQIGNPLRDWNEIPKWIQDVYYSDQTVHRIVKDWRMTSKPLSHLMEKLAIAMFELKNTWQTTYENAIKNAKITSRTIIGE